MKQIFIALAITAIACGNAQAQNCNSMTAHKTAATHKTVKHNAPMNKVATTPADRTVSCRVVPYQVCKIQPDKKTVKCYETTDLNTLAPMNDKVTTYGPTGPLPNQPMVRTMPTLVIGKQPNMNYCRWDENNKTSICYYNGRPITRDADGNYHY